MAFRVGQEVICVNADKQILVAGDRAVVEGERYTIRMTYDHYGQPGVHLVGVNNPSGRGYRVERFRPAVERKTDISIFTAMLNPSHEKVRA